MALKLARDAKPDEALKTLETLSTQGAAGYPLLAKFHAASINVQNSNFEAAAAQYWDIANTADDPAYGQLAVLMAVMQDLQQPSPDYAKMKSRMMPLLIEGSAWRFSARELSAAIAMREGDMATARTTLEGLANDATAPASIKGRAKAFISVLGQ